MRLRNHYCSGKAINITYSECVSSFNYLARKAHAPYYIPPVACPAHTHALAHTPRNM